MSDVQADKNPVTPQEIVTTLAKLAIELAQYASYAEIVKLLGINQSQVRALSDRIFALNHDLERHLDAVDAPTFDGEGLIVERIERYETMIKSSGAADAERSAYESAKALKIANEDNEKLRDAADKIAPYLIYTIGEESPGHHPTLPSAVGAFLHAFEIETAEKRLARTRKALSVNS